MSETRIRVTQLFRYPIKSCEGEALYGGSLGTGRFPLDREFMVVDEKGNFLSQRTHPRLALIRVSFDRLPPTWKEGEGNIAIFAQGVRPHQSSAWGEECAEKRTVRVHQDECGGLDMGYSYGKWFSEFLGTPCRLVRKNPTVRRSVERNDDQEVAFSDGFPLLLCSEESLAALNARLSRPIAMTRFRPNIVVSGAPAFDEDNWKEMIVERGLLGNSKTPVLLRGVKRCERCNIPRVDPLTGILDQDINPLKTLAAMGRRLPKFPNDPAYGDGIIFGMNCVVVDPSPNLDEIAISDSLIVRSRYD